MLTQGVQLHILGVFNVCFSEFTGSLDGTLRSVKSFDVNLLECPLMSGGVIKAKGQQSTYSGPLSGSSRKATSQKKTATVDISFMFSGRILLIELIV